MVRSLAALLTLFTLGTACSGTVIGVPLISRSSSAALDFGEEVTAASQEILAYDPSKHSLDIEIALPLEQPEDIDVFIVTSGGLRFQILSTFRNCEVDSSGRHCFRDLPVLPSEKPNNWRVEAVRQTATEPTSVRVDVTWVPLS